MAYYNREAAYVVEQPLAVNPFDPPSNEWSVGLCNICEDCSQFWYAYCCFCCFMCSLAGTINESKLSCCCVPNVLLVYRMKVRSMLKIEGDSFNDWCATCCCPVCAALQMKNELASRGIN